MVGADGDGNQPPELVPRALFDLLETVPSGSNKHLTENYHKVPTLDETADVTPFLEKIGREGGRGQYIQSFDDLSFGIELWDNVNNAQKQMETLLSWMVLLTYFTSKETDDAVPYEEYQEDIDWDWIGHGLDKNVQKMMLMVMAPGIAIRKGHDDKKNGRVTFLLKNRTDDVVDTVSFLVLAHLDARALRFILSESFGFAIENIGHMLKAGKTIPRRILTRGKETPDYADTVKDTELPLYDRFHIGISHVLALNGSVCGLVEGIKAICYHIFGRGVNIKAEHAFSFSTAKRDEVTIRKPAAFYDKRLKEEPELNDYIEVERRMKLHRKNVNAARAENRKRTRSNPKAWKSVISCERESEENLAPRTDGVEGILAQSTNRAFSDRLQFFAKIVHLISLAGCEYNLVVAVIDATTHEEAVNNIVEVVNEYLEDNDDDERFEIDEFNIDGELYWLAFELQVLLMRNWSHNLGVGVFWVNFWKTWSRIQNPKNTKFKIVQGILVIEDTHDAITAGLNIWYRHVAGRYVYEFTFAPAESSYEGRLLAMMGVCFDNDVYTRVVRENTQQRLNESIMKKDSRPIQFANISDIFQM